MDDGGGDVTRGEGEGGEVGGGGEGDGVALVGADEVVGGVWVWVVIGGDRGDGRVGFEGEALFGVVGDGGADVGEGYG